MQVEEDMRWGLGESGWRTEWGGGEEGAGWRGVWEGMSVTAGER